MLSDRWYQLVMRPLLFRLDPELTHNLAISIVRAISYTPLWQKLVHPLFTITDPALATELWGLSFPNPLGLAAGFDKNAEGIGAWQNLGFGFAEVGTITAHAQAGNPKPRLFRLMADQAILNRMGFNNHGAEAIAQQITSYRQKYPVKIPIGINIGKSKITPLEKSAEDYLASFQLCQNLGDYFVINVSSPNTTGLRTLQAGKELAQIIKLLQSANHLGKPLLVKIAPDLDYPAIDQILAVCLGENISGIIATNTTISREGIARQYLNESGGVSGQPLQKPSTAIIKYIYQATQGKLPIIGVGGINSAESAWQKFTAGASLVQLYTGLIYHGFGLSRQILGELLAKLRSLGLQNIRQIIGNPIPFS